MSHWIKVSNNNLYLLLFHSFLVRLNSHSYDLFVPILSCVFSSYEWTPITLIPSIMSLVKLDSLASSQWLIVLTKSGVMSLSNYIVFN